MSNEHFFLEVCNRGYLLLYSEEPTVENSIKSYLFRYHGTDKYKRIRFNQVGGFIDIQEII